jgi:hypothetical protein
MRLGFWNRLAVVGFVLTLLFSPIYFGIDAAQERDHLRSIMYDACMKDAKESYPDPAYMKRFAVERECLEKRYPIPDPYPVWTWANWWTVIQGSALGYGIIYALIWIIVATCKWVWRGRRKKNTETA